MLGKYAFRMRQGPATIARGTFNDLPFFREPSTAFRNTADNADHLLVPGENTMTLDVWDGPPSPDAPTIKGPVELHVLRCEDEGIIEAIAWPAFAIESGEDQMNLKMPFTWTVKFQVPDDHPPPIYAKNFAEEVPEEGTPELHEAVRKIHDALERHDARDFVASFRLKLDEVNRYYGEQPGANESNVVRAYEGRFAKKFEVARLEPKELVFESRAKNRAVYVRRRDGRPVFSARRVEGEESSSFEIDPIFVRRDNTWTLLR